MRMERAVLKICTKCHEAKTVQSFHKAKRQSSGYRPDCKSCVNARHALNRKRYYQVRAMWTKKNPDRRRKYSQDFRRKLRLETIAAYGSKCSCCGETIPEFLTIDHIFNDGAKQRKEEGYSGISLYALLKRNGFPKDRYQLLCMNCNFAKGKHGQCPHTRQE